MIIKLEKEVEPFDIPSVIYIKDSDLEIELKDISEVDLHILCDDFMVSVFKKANKNITLKRG